MSTVGFLASVVDPRIAGAAAKQLSVSDLSVFLIVAYFEGACTWGASVCCRLLPILRELAHSQPN